MFQDNKMFSEKAQDFQHKFSVGSLVHHLANCLDENVHLVAHEASQVDGLARIILGEGLWLATVALGPDENGGVKMAKK